MEGTHPNGDNLITCLNDGSWDNDPPECVPEKISAEIIEVEEIVFTETTTPVTVIVRTVPDKAFWKSLHTYLFFGCHDSSKRSSLCDKYASNLTDLNNLEADTSPGIQNTDQKLIDLFESTLASINFHTIDIGNLFDYILYQNEIDEEDKLDKIMEDSFRLTLCFYMNILSSEKPILVDTDNDGAVSEGQALDSAEDIGRKIIRLLRIIVQPAFVKFVEMQEEMTSKKPLIGLQALIASRESENGKD